MEDMDDLDVESLVEASRTPKGRSILADKGFVPSLLRAISSSSSSSSPLPSHLLPCLRLLRNLCAGETANQHSFVRSGGVDVVSSVLLYSARKEAASVEVVRVGIQALANVAAAGEEHRVAVWRRMFPSGLLELAGIGDSGVSDPLCMILHSSCCSRDGRGGSKVRMEELLGVEEGLRILVRIIRTACSVGSCGDWLQFLVSRLCFEETCFFQLYSELNFSDDEHKFTDNEIKKPQFTTEQVFFMDVISEILSKNPYEGQISENFALGVFQIFKYALSAVDFTTHGLPSLPTSIPEVDVLGYSLNILKDICAMEEYSTTATSGIIGLLLSQGLCQVLLNLLRNLKPPKIIGKSHSHGEHPETLSVAGLFCPYKGFRRDIVAAIGNVMFGRKEVQDEIRREDGILLLLQQCVVDEDNPFLREWGIWTVRNLLEGNEDNQKVVAELELQGPVNTPEISAMGLKVEVDEKNRRVKLVNI